MISTDRVAIVTGGGQGIGLTVAERMLDSGGSVSIWDRDQALLDALDSKYGSDGKVQALKVGHRRPRRRWRPPRPPLEPLRQDRRAHQQRGHRRPQHADLGIPAAGLHGRRAYRPCRHLLLLPRRGAAHDRAELRAHRQPQLRGRQGRQPQRAGLFLDQGRACWRSPSRWARNWPSYDIAVNCRHARRRQDHHGAEPGARLPRR